MWSWIVLKAELKSIDSILSCELGSSMCLLTSFNRIKLASWTLLFLQYANCFGSQIVSTLTHEYFFSIFSRHFIILEVKTTGLKSSSTSGKAIFAMGLISDSAPSLGLWSPGKVAIALVQVVQHSIWVLWLHPVRSHGFVSLYTPQELHHTLLCVLEVVAIQLA